ncbi:hypothetical protein D3C81_801430 [compost metagenome]
MSRIQIQLDELQNFLRVLHPCRSPVQMVDRIKERVLPICVVIAVQDLADTDMDILLRFVIDPVIDKLLDIIVCKAVHLCLERYNQPLRFDGGPIYTLILTTLIRDGSD